MKNCLIAILLFSSLTCFATKYDPAAFAEPKFLSKQETEKRLIKTRQEAKTTFEKRYSEILLAEFYVNAYAKKDDRVPTKDLSSGRFFVDHAYWFNGSGEENRRKRIVRTVEQPVNAVRLEYLKKAKELLSKLIVEQEYDYRPAELLAWCLLQEGRKAEARAQLKTFVEKFMKRNYNEGLEPYMSMALPLNYISKTIALSVPNQPKIQISIFPRLIHDHTVGARLVAASGKTLEWRAQADAYLKSPTEPNLRALIAKITSDVPDPETRIYAGDNILAYDYTRSKLTEMLRDWHRAHEANEPPADSKGYGLLQAQSVTECLKQKGTLKFTEGDLSTRLVCVALLAWRTKTWGHCREAFLPRESGEFNFCVHYLVYRSKKADLCREVERYPSLSMYSNFHRYSCEEVLVEQKGQMGKMAPGTPGAFMSDSDPVIVGSEPTLGAIGFFLKGNGAGNPEIQHLAQIESIGPGAGKPRGPSLDGYNLQDPEAIPYATISVKVELLDAKGNVTLTKDVPLIFFATEDSLGEPPANFEISPENGNVLGLYLSSLDPVKDGAEIAAIRRKAWIKQRFHKMRPQAIE